ncbi:uncharacterized protein L969DRAFT_84004 [Mixia osmundae IAM 14324]|uniref:Coatomer subunit beta' n=1 Tax=Mixia osmundae (strain CBS 9802 / IAM 14324 / JCM 22182 / KY 12970) TaxID=764103 RepID=G7DZX5_MIXOS|nr:uncharacterized protein L969DRAFT_84004 [Mixia osmundae IAM 14324]KEI42126.1 hypothetical protein L969DRAFT_84004 [Mixia osmundae IAM 14324]GAA96135.1 hypothetical protein E5Q_02796 [Mixia osmundae IAM 14324]
MPMLLEVTRKALVRSERVKSIDFHPTEPWVIAGLYTGRVVIWNTDTGALVKTFEVTEVPVRCVRFITRKNWFICGSDDFHLRIFNYNTQEKIAAFEAHPDYIRCLAVHPTQSLVLTGSDDMTIKLWDWEKNWKCVQMFEGHTHYIMNIAFNPKDSNTFASACLDRTVKVWSLGAPMANFTLDAHDKGVNYVEYYHGGDKPYLVTTGDDRLVKIWDYHSKSCIQTLEGHTSNVSFAIFHPSLPIIISGSEDGTVKIWHAATYRLENTLNYGLERAWCVAYGKKRNDVAFGFDEGAVVVKLGREEPSVSMDSNGKVVYARNSEVLIAHIQNQGEDAQDGQRLAVPVKELGNTEVYAQSLQHSPNGRFVTVCGDGEFIIYTALAWRNKSYGSALGFAWANDSNTYAVRETNTKIKVFRNFKERPGLVTIGYTASGVYGGALLSVKGSGFVDFYDWDNGNLVRRIEVDAQQILWSTTGNYVAIAGDESIFVLRYDRTAYIDHVESGAPSADDGVEAAFELTAEVADVVRTGQWIGDCFVYTTGANRLNYLVGSQSHTISHFDQQMFLLGYLPGHNRLYLCDKDVNIMSYSLSLAVIEYQTAILRGDEAAANELLPSIPSHERNRIARFLEAQDLKELALEVSTDPDHQFELSVQLDDLERALSIARSSPSVGSEAKWRTIGDRALATWKFHLAEECFVNAKDLSALLLYYTSVGDSAGLEKLATMAEGKGQTNIAFASRLQLGDSVGCVSLLLATERPAEASLFARTFAPSQVPHATQAWKASLLAQKKTRLADAIADPAENPEAFEEGWEASLAKEAELKQHSSATTNGLIDFTAGEPHAEPNGVHHEAIDERFAGLDLNHDAHNDATYDYGATNYAEQADLLGSFADSNEGNGYAHAAPSIKLDAIEDLDADDNFV